MTRTKKIVGFTLGTLLLLIVVLVVVIATFDWNRVKPTINEKVSEAIGRPFAINGDLTVQWRRSDTESGWRHWVPWPHVAANDIVVGNTEWAKAPQFATLQRGEFSLSPLPLISHRVVIRSIQLTQPSADLQRLKDGRANWDFNIKSADSDTDEPSKWVLDINEIGFDKGRVGFADETLQADLEVLIDPLGKPVPYPEIAGAAALPEGAPIPKDYVFGWAVKGKYKAQALKGEGKIGGMLALRDADTPFPVQADVSVGDTKAVVVGTVTEPLNLGALDVKLKFSGKSMADLYPLIGVALPDTPPYSTDGRLVAELQRAEGARFKYENFNGRVGQSDLHGSLTFALGQPRPKLTGELTSKQLRLADLGPLVGVQSGGAKKPSDETKKQPSNKALPVSEFRTERWRDMDADVRLKAGKIEHGDSLPLSDLNVHAVMDAGKLTLDPLNFAMAGGSMNTTIQLDGAKTPMTGRVKATARRLRLKQLFSTTESMQKSLGQMNGDVALTGTGNSVAALLGSSNGELKLIVNDGVISRSLMEIAGLNVGNYVISKLFGDDEVAINCGVTDAGIKDGLLTTRLFLFDTENALIKIDGTANFKTEALDLDITPESKGFRVFSLRSPLYVEGTFKDPKAGVKVVPLAARGAGMVVLGAALTPVAGLLALIAPSAGEEEENQCTTLLRQMQKPVKAPPPGKRAR